jgi:hypothetical protein
MCSWFKKETRLEKLKKRYSDLMRKSYKTALCDKEKSDLVKKKAREIFEEINYLSLKHADK